MPTVSRAPQLLLLPPLPALARAALALGICGLVVCLHPGPARADDERGWRDRGESDRRRPWMGDEEGEDEDHGRGWEKERRREQRERRREEQERWREEQELRREDRERRREWERERRQEEDPAEEGMLLEWPQAGPSYGEFQEALTPYGEWLDTPEYGRVWRPTQVSSDWRPYYQGHWAWTNAGWYWVADEPYGWAVYHYGRWAFAADAGWLWLPGQRWAPAWVSWRWGEGYAGWCPLGPRGYVSALPVEYVIVQQQHFLQPVPQYAVPTVASAGFLPLTHPIPPAQPGPHAGPVISQVAAATRQPVRAFALVDAAAPPRGAPSVVGGKVFVYRPHTVPVAQPAPWGPSSAPEVRSASIPARPLGVPAERPIAVPSRQLGWPSQPPAAAAPAPHRGPQALGPPARAAPERPEPGRPVVEERGGPSAGPRAAASGRLEPSAGDHPYVSPTPRPMAPVFRAQAPQPLVAPRSEGVNRAPPAAAPSDQPAPRAMAAQVKQQSR